MMRSKFESEVQEQLTQLGIPFLYESQRIPYVTKGAYYPDFEIPGTKILLEAKGYFSEDDRRKHRYIKAQYPELDIRFVFQNAYQSLGKGYRMTYGEWCDKHDSLWCHKEIPEAWARETKRLLQGDKALPATI